MECRTGYYEGKGCRGVDVRLMYDDLGTIQTLPPHYYRQMEEAGIKCAVFNPFRPRLNSMFNYRDHRKITVIDGDVGFCGGLNLADEYINAYEKHGHWKDTARSLMVARPTERELHAFRASEWCR